MPGEGEDDPRGFEWRHLDRLLATPVPALPARPQALFALAWSPDGKRLAVGGLEGVILLHEYPGGRLRHTLRGHTDCVTALAFAPAGGWLVSASQDRTLRLWDVDKGVCQAVWKGAEQTVWCVAVSPDGKTVASGEGTVLGNQRAPAPVRLWDVASGQAVARLDGHQGVVFAVAFTPAGRGLASGGNFGAVKFWIVEERKELPIPQLHDSLDPVVSVAFSPDGLRLASRSLMRKVIVQELRRPKDMPARLETSVGPTPATSIAFADNRTLAVNADGAVELFDVAGGAPVRLGTLRGPSGEAGSLAFRPGGGVLAAICNQGATLQEGPAEVLLWEPDRHLDLRTLRTGGWLIRRLAWSPGGRLLAVGGDRAVELWDCTPGGQRRHATFVAAEGEVRAAAFAPDGQTLAVGCVRGDRAEVVLWGEGGTRRAVLPAGSALTDLAFADARTLFAAAGSTRVRAWDVGKQAAKEAAGLRLPIEVERLACTADGGTLIAAGAGTVLWDLADGRVRARLPRPATALAVSGKAPLAALADGKTVRIIETGSGAVTATLTGLPRVDDVAFAPDGQVLAVLGLVARQSALRMYDTATWQERATLPDGGTHLAFAPTGGVLALAGREKLYLRLATGPGTQPPATPDFRPLLDRQRSKVQVRASSTWDGWPAEALIDGDPTRPWSSAAGDSAGKKGTDNGPWLELHFAEPVTVRRVVALGGQPPGYAIRRARVELLDGQGRVLAGREVEGIGPLGDLQWALERPAGGVRAVRLRSLADEGGKNKEGTVVLGEVWLE
jgi:WD40 repeat protein